MNPRPFTCRTIRPSTRRPVALERGVRSSALAPPASQLDRRPARLGRPAHARLLADRERAQLAAARRPREHRSHCRLHRQLSARSGRRGPGLVSRRKWAAPRAVWARPSRSRAMSTSPLHGRNREQRVVAAHAGVAWCRRPPSPGHRADRPDRRPATRDAVEPGRRWPQRKLAKGRWGLDGVPPARNAFVDAVAPASAEAIGRRPVVRPTRGSPEVELGVAAADRCAVAGSSSPALATRRPSSKAFQAGLLR